MDYEGHKSHRTEIEGTLREFRRLDSLFFVSVDLCLLFVAWQLLRVYRSFRQKITAAINKRHDHVVKPLLENRGFKGGSYKRRSELT